MSRYLLECGPEGVAIIDAGDGHVVVEPTTWEMASRMIAALNAPAERSPAPCDCARLRAALLQIAAVSGERVVLRLANEALDLWGGEHG
jgi:hypothetical protein